MLCLVVLATVAGAVLISCGGGDEKAAVPKAETTGGTGEAGDTGELKRYRANAVGVSIAVPRSWEAISSDDVDQERLQEMAEENPSLKQMFSGLYEEGSPIKLMAVDPERVDGFNTNLNVLVSDAAPVETVTELGNPERIKEEIAVLEDVLQGPVDSDFVSLPAGRAHRLSLEIEFNVEGKPLHLYQQQYELISSAGKFYSLVFTTNFSRRSEYEDIFLESAQSFQID